MNTGLEAGEDGHAVGKDPRIMSPDELAALGHRPTPPVQALRARCIDCCAGSPSEVRRCTAVRCPSWPYRMGVSPYRKKAKPTDKERAAAGERLRRGRQAAAGKQSRLHSTP